MASSNPSQHSGSNNGNINGGISPPPHSNHNSISNMNVNNNLSNVNMNDLDDINVVANIPSTFSDPVHVQDYAIPYDETAMEMDNNITTFDINNILGGLMSDGGQISSQSQNRLFSVGNGMNSVTNMSVVSGGGANAMSVSNSFI